MTQSRPAILSNRIDQLFARTREEDRAALVLYITAGFPTMQTTIDLLPILAEAGCDLLELGVPFSDPIADGPVIQRASTIALNAGASFPKILDALKDFRAISEIPVVLFGALNPFLIRGLEQTANRAVECGADGFLAADVPLEESDEFRALLAAKGLHLITLVAPTTPGARIREISDRSSGFLYCISYKGVTGKGSAPAPGVFRREAEAYLQKVRAHSDLPLALGFGIRAPQDVRDAVDAGAEGVVVGTALINVIEEATNSGADVKQVVGDYVRSLAAELKRR